MPAQSACLKVRWLSWCMINLPWSLGERAPRGLAHIACRGSKPLLHATVAGDRGQYTTPSIPGRVQDQLAIGRDRRRFVARSLRQYLHLSRREILDRDVEAAAVAAHENKSLAVGQMPRRHVIAAVESHPLDRPVAERQPVDLRAAAAVRREQDGLPIGCKVRFGIDRELCTRWE